MQDTHYQTLKCPIHALWLLEKIIIRRWEANLHPGEALLHPREANLPPDLTLSPDKSANNNLNINLNTLNK